MTTATTSSNTETLGREPREATPRSLHRWWALTVLALAQFLVVLDASIVNIAVPSLGRDLALDATALSWVITAYVLPFGGLLLLGGRLADRFGHRRLFLIGVVGFIAASALAGLSVGGGMLLGARALQGAAAALLAPASLALVTQLFVTAKDRGTALGIWGAVAGIGSAAGVLLGGVLTAAFGWQAVFFVNVPVGILVLLVIPLLVNRDPRGAQSRLDIPGAVTVTVGLTAAVAAFTQVEQFGFASPITLGLFASALALLGAFVIIERRTAAPLVPFAIFRRGSVTGGNLAMLFAGGATTALFFALSIYLQRVLHYDALSAGISQLPLAATLVLVAGIIPSLISRIGVQATLVGALATLAGGLVWLSFAPSTAGFVASLLGPFLLIGIGLGAAFVAGTQLAVHGIEAADAGLASGLVNTSQQVGGALGLAILATLAAARTTDLSTHGSAAADALTGGFGWLFLGAAALSLLGAAAVAFTARER